MENEMVRLQIERDKDAEFLALQSKICNQRWEIEKLHKLRERDVELIQIFRETLNVIDPTLMHKLVVEAENRVKDKDKYKESK